MNKVIIAYLVFFSFFGCNQKSSFKGYWKGRVYYEEMNFDIFAKFDDKKFEISNHVNSPYYYSVFGNTITFRPTEFGGKFSFRYVFVNDSLYFYRSECDTLYSSFKKIDPEDIIKNLINESDIQINLASGYSDKISIIDLPDQKRKFIFFGYKNDTLAIYFNDKQYSLNNGLFDTFQQAFESEFQLRESTFNLFIDKNIKYSEYIMFTKNLRLAGIAKVRFILHSEHVDSISCFQRMLPSYPFRQDIESLPDNLRTRVKHTPFPVYPIKEISKEKIKRRILVQLTNDSTIFKVYNRSNLSTDLIKDLILSKNVEPDFNIYCQKDISFGKYIEFWTSTQLLINEIRDEISTREYGVAFSKLDFEKKDSIRKLYYYGFRQIDIEDYNYLKSSR